MSSTKIDRKIVKYRVQKPEDKPTEKAVVAATPAGHRQGGGRQAPRHRGRGDLP